MRVSRRVQTPRHGLLARLGGRLHREAASTPELKHAQSGNDPRRLLKRLFELGAPGVGIHPARPSDVGRAESAALHARQALLRQRDKGHVGFVQDCVVPRIGVEDEAVRGDVCGRGLETPVIGFAEVQRGDPYEDFWWCGKCMWENRL